MSLQDPDQGIVSPAVDLTMDDSDSDTVCASDSDDGLSAKTSLKRKLSCSSKDDDNEFISLRDLRDPQANINRNILQPSGPRPAWNFHDLKISKPTALSRSNSKASTPPYCQQPRESFRSDSSQSSRLSQHSSNPRARTNKKEKGFVSTNSGLFSRRVSAQLPSLAPFSRREPTSKRQSRCPNANMADRSPPLPIAIDSDDELEISYSFEELEIQEKIELPPDTEKEVINLEEYEAAQDAEELEDDHAIEFMTVVAVDETNKQLMEVIDLEGDETPDDQDDGLIDLTKLSDDEILWPGPQLIGPATTVNNNTKPTHLHLNHAKQGGCIYRAGDGVEFMNGTFMRIEYLRENACGHIILCGRLLTRHYQHCLDLKDCQHTRLFPSKDRLNELVWTVTVDGSTSKNTEYVERDLTGVKCPRNIIFTNQTWPCLSTRSYRGKRGTYGLQNAPMYCRWKRIKQMKVKDLCQDYEETIVRLTLAEADPDRRFASWKLRRAARGQHIPQGGGSLTMQQEYVAPDGTTKTRSLTTYTFADGFCGAGGASSGADQAGLTIQWAFDEDHKAVVSYRKNFGKRGTISYQESVGDFLKRVEKDPGSYRVDVLHVSPPCQGFSLANTRGDEGVALAVRCVLFSVRDLIEVLKPRVVTMEQTSGLLYAHKEWLAAVINDMVELGYSVRWKLMQSEQYGVPQIRKRLVIIAAGPGETLPPWPKPTHGTGLKRPVTIDDVITQIPPGASHQQVISKFKNGPKAPYRGDTQARTVTCGGGDESRNYHPTGLRHFTVREFARLQTFLMLHSFGNANLTTAKKQIGNAFPPSFARAVFKAVIKSLKDSDTKEWAERQAAMAVQRQAQEQGRMFGILALA